MKRILVVIGTILFLAAGTAWAADDFVVTLAPVKDYKGEAQGKLVINTATGTDLSIDITGLDPKGLYTAFFVNVKSRMFEGIGPSPHVLKVSPEGTVNFQGKMDKNIYKKFVRVGIYLNPKDRPIGNPVGVKTSLGPLVEFQQPKMVLEGKLR